MAGKIGPLEWISVKAPLCISERRKPYSAVLRCLKRDLMWKVLLREYLIYMTILLLMRMRPDVNRSSSTSV